VLVVKSNCRLANDSIVTLSISQVEFASGINAQVIKMIDRVLLLIRLQNLARQLRYLRGVISQEDVYAVQLFTDAVYLSGNKESRRDSLTARSQARAGCTMILII